MDATTVHLDIPVAGERIVRVRQYGAADGRPVVVHHGTPGSGVQSAEVGRGAEAAGLRLVCYDRAGYGGSTAAPGRDVAAVAADIEAVADALGVARFATWGYSGGGPHVLAAAALLGKRVTRAAAWCSVAPADAEGLDFTAGMADANVEEFGFAQRGRDAIEPALRAELDGGLPSSPDAVVAMLSPFCSPTDAAALDRRAPALLAEIVTGLEAGIDGWVDDDLAFVRSWGFDLDAIRVPVAFWQGGEDRFVPAAHGSWLGAHVPGAELHLLPGAGHLSLWLDELDATLAWLAAG